MEQKKEYWLIVFVKTVHRLIYHQLCKIQRILCGEHDFILKLTLNIKETTLARYFIKVTARPSFTGLRDIK